MLRTCAFLLTALCAAGAWAETHEPVAGEQIQLKMASGLIPGEVVSVDDKQITLKRTIAGKKGPMSVTMPYERDKITDITLMPSANDEYDKKAAESPKTAKDQLALAKWCQEKGLDEKAVAHAKEAAALDAADNDSRAFLNGLGWYELDGKWLNEDDYLAKTGKVKYGGKLMTPKEAEEAKAKAEENKAANEVESKTSRLASIDKRMAANSEDIAEIDAKIGKVNQDLSAAQKDASEMESAKTALDQAQKQLDAARASAQANAGATNTTNLTALQTSLDTAQANYNKAKAKGSAAAAQVNRCKSQLKDLEQKKASLAKRGTDLQNERNRAAQDLQKATEEAAKAGKKP
jgi:predicted  nucleic acid-binding Zn-ribbon protein